MQDITIHNFRCYEDKQMTFRRGVNLLIGDNSAGKTSLLRACNFVMNSFFSGYSDENTVWKSVEDDDFMLQVSEQGSILPERPIAISFHAGEWDFPPVAVMAGGKMETVAGVGPDEELRIEKTSKKNSRNLVTGLRVLKDYAALLQQHSHVMADGRVCQNNVLPVYAYFSTEDIHSSRKINRERFKEYNHKTSFGYYECYDCKGLFDYWVDRLLVLEEAEVGQLEIQTVRKAIAEALGANGCGIIEELIIRPRRGKVFFRYTDHRMVEANLLSDGYRRLINIVMDIAFRCALLNKEKFGDECYKHTHGTVIIDEIDEHLHPALQVRVLKALQTTFPMIQFIVSTHAPMVMSSVDRCPENVVYKLEYHQESGRYTHRELNTYGLDASTILGSSMGQVPRDLDVAKDLERLFQQIDEQKLPEAKETLHRLYEVMENGDPELARAEAMISFME